MPEEPETRPSTMGDSRCTVSAHALPRRVSQAPTAQRSNRHRTQGALPPQGFARLDEVTACDVIWFHHGACMCSASMAGFQSRLAPLCLVSSPSFGRHGCNRYAPNVAMRSLFVFNYARARVEAAWLLILFFLAVFASIILPLQLFYCFR